MVFSRVPDESVRTQWTHEAITIGGSIPFSLVVNRADSGIKQPKAYMYKLHHHLSLTFTFAPKSPWSLPSWLRAKPGSHLVANTAAPGVWLEPCAGY